MLADLQLLGAWTSKDEGDGHDGQHEHSDGAGHEHARPEVDLRGLRARDGDHCLVERERDDGGEDHVERVRLRTEASVDCPRAWKLRCKTGVC